MSIENIPGNNQSGITTQQMGYEEYLNSQLTRSLSKSSYDTSVQTEYLLKQLSAVGKIPPEASFLCVGCRNKYELDRIQAFGAREVVGVDLHSTDPRILVMDMHALDFPSESFDVVYSCHSLEHALDPQKVCSEFVRVLKPGGFVIVEVPTGCHEQNTAGMPTWDVTIATREGKQILVPRNTRGLVPDIWDLKDQHHLEELLKPATPKWSELAHAILNPQQRVIRIICQKPPRDSTLQPSEIAPSWNIVVPTRLSEQELSPRHEDLQYSARRYFVDEFFFRRVRAVPQGSTVLDFGGKRKNKRGQFNIEKFPLKTQYVNLDPSTEPDFFCDVAQIPVPDRYCDVVILAEVAEHLKEPQRVLREAARVLKPGGVLLATAPFFYRIHPDPVDVARYLPQWWGETLIECGFTSIEVEPQGYMFSSLLDVVRDWVRDMQDRNALPAAIAPYVPGALQLARHWALSMERSKGCESKNVLSEVSTGFGVCARRKG